MIIESGFYTFMVPFSFTLKEYSELHWNWRYHRYVAKNYKDKQCQYNLVTKQQTLNQSRIKGFIDNDLKAFHF